MRRTLSRGLLLMTALLVLTSVVRLLGQESQPDHKSSAFEVASIKPNNSGPDQYFSFNYFRAGGRFNASNVTLGMLIRNAYQLQESQLVGGPSWVNSDRFDIVAKADLDSSQPFMVQRSDGPSRLQIMMQTLIAERFKLVVHHEARPTSVFALVVARAGRLGPALRPAAGDCDVLAAAARARSGSASSSSQQPLAVSTRCGASMAVGHFMLGGGTLFQLANTLSRIVGQQVVDSNGPYRQF